MRTDDPILTALAALEPQAQDAVEEVRRLEDELKTATARSLQLKSVVQNLRMLVQGQTADPSINEETGVEHPGSDESRSEDERSQPSDDGPPRVRSTDYVVRIVEDARPKAVTRNEIVQTMMDAGLTRGMKNARNAIGSALYRAARDGRIERLADNLFRAYAPQLDQPLTTDVDPDGREVHRAEIEF